MSNLTLKISAGPSRGHGHQHHHHHHHKGRPVRKVIIKPNKPRKVVKVVAGKPIHHHHHHHHKPWYHGIFKFKWFW